MADCRIGWRVEWVTLCRVAGIAIMSAAAPACGNGGSGGGGGGGGGSGGDGGGEPYVSPPEVAAEHVPIPDVVRTGAGPERHEQPAAAVGDGVTLMLWSDNRAEPWGGSGADIVGLRYAADGTPMDDSPIRIAVGHHEDLSPAVAFGGDTFFVAWWVITRFPNGEGGTGLIRGARVASDGTLLDPDGIALADNAAPPHIVVAGDRFYIAFEANVGGELRVMTVSPSGEIITPATVVSDHGFFPSMASDGSRVMLSYVYEESVDDPFQRFVLLDANLQPTAEESWPVVNGLTTAAAGGPTGFVTAWNDQTTSSMRRLGATGDWLDTSPIAAPDDVVSMVRDGNGYLVASMYGIRRLEDAGDQLGAPVLFSDPEAFVYGPQLASDGSARVVAWEDLAEAEVLSARVDATGAPLDPTSRVAPRGSPSQLVPALGSVGGQPFLAFTEASKDGTSIRYGFIDPFTGAPTNGFTELPNARYPAIATGQDSTVVVWVATDTGSVLSARFLEDGTLSAPNEIASEVVGAPRIAATADGFAVTSSVAGESDLYDSTAFLIALTPDGVRSSSAPVGSGYAVPTAIGNDTVVAVRGDPLYPDDLAVGCSANRPSPTLGPIAPGDMPSLASNGELALVVWTDDASRQALGALVDADCSIVTSFEVTEAGVEAKAPTAYFDGTSFLVLWRKLGTESDLYATRVASDGTILDPEGFVISAEPGNELAAAFVSFGGQGLTAYPRFDPAADGVRIWVRSIGGNGT
ncbi:MAG: hypothetical protein HOW73_43710 [Polyangiaceae bacterium]|nr:hypothetical protein [Polyangiaceae bacterium]